MDKVYTLADAETMELADVPLAVLGKPIAHSMSPLMHNAALRRLSLSRPELAGWHYYKFEIDPKDLGEALRLFHARNFRGINLTIPHKEVVFEFLEGADEFARLAGAANTLVRTDGGWHGSNTDGFGLAHAVKSFSGMDFAGADVAVLGAGGAARAACFYSALNGAASVRISNRTRLKAQCIAEELKLAGFDSAGELSEIAPGSVIINATSVGLHPGDAPVLDFSKVPDTCAFFDMPYVRGGETPSVLAARAAGLRAASGLAMLAWQGAKSLSIWAGLPDPPGEIMLAALEA